MEDKELKGRAQLLSDKMGFNSVNRVSEVALQIGIAVMEEKAYWGARIDGVLVSTMAEYITDGLKAREERIKAKRK